MSKDSYDLTIHGLLRKRKSLLTEMERLREQVSVLINDVGALDRVLRSLGYSEPLGTSGAKPYARPFARNEIRRTVLDLLREVGSPVTTRDLSIQFAKAHSLDHLDRGMMLQVSKRVSKVLGIMTENGTVRRVRCPEGKIEYLYELAMPS